MTKKCIYCGAAVDDNSVIDFCERCGVMVWGQKMFNTIKKNMEDARESGDLELYPEQVKALRGG
ncbi:MAG: hypothetical protein KKA64_01430 [Nanoarchaeota archaeon]|nr:hypothetical protein [Nanoarchaeota archaeon]